VFSPDVPRARRYSTKEFKLGPSNLDITVVRDLGGSITVPLPYINAEFLNDQVGWVPNIIIRNYAGTNSLDLDPGAVAIDPDNDDITVNVTYPDALQTLGMVDPGTWDLYASRPSVTEPGTTETVYIASGNLQIQMAQSSINAFTIGNTLT
jgi:hypothetical protein